MNIEKMILDTITVLRQRGDLDTATSPDAQAYITDSIDQGASDILISPKDVGFVSSAGLRILLAAAEKMVAIDGRLRISDLNETVNEVFEISGFSSILNVYLQEQDA